MGDAAKHCQIGLAIGRLCSDQVCRFISCTTIDEVETENFFHLINILSCVVKHFFFTNINNLVILSYFWRPLGH